MGRDSSADADVAFCPPICAVLLLSCSPGIQLLPPFDHFTFSPTIRHDPGNGAVDGLGIARFNPRRLATVTKQVHYYGKRLNRIIDAGVRAETNEGHWKPLIGSLIEAVLHELDPEVLLNYQ